jgi:hypothetical protein
MHVSELKNGQEVQGWVRPGLALSLGRNADGSVFRYVPMRARPSRQNDLQRFLGWVSANDSDMQVLSLNVTGIGPRGGSNQEPALPVNIAYPVFARLRLLSAISYPVSTKQDIRHPTNNSHFMPYRTLVEVSLVLK